jgi:adenine C2-methylase RlmN of 23S rRNA A2503 and tRNA A37
MKSLGIFKDNVDDSIKCVFDVENHNIIEMTLLQNRVDTDVVCVPTHYFCNLGCVMCHLTNNKLNKVSKTIDYKNFVLALSLTVCNQKKDDFGNLMANYRRTNKKKLLLSFMGVGEPTLNLKLIQDVNKNINYLKRFLCYDEIGIALATMLPNKNLKDFIDVVDSENIPLKIHFSLHSPIDSIRHSLIPSSKNTIVECFDMLKEYNDTISKNKTIMSNYNHLHKTNDLIEIHYTLIKDVNDSEEELNELCTLLNKYPFTIKFIKFNPKDDMSISEKEEYWKNEISKRCNVRVKSYCPPGKNIGSSCGEFTKHYYHEEIETEEEKKEFELWKQKYQIEV